jgi:hypothetical protein
MTTAFVCISTRTLGRLLSCRHSADGTVPPELHRQTVAPGRHFEAEGAVFVGLGRFSLVWKQWKRACRYQNRNKARQIQFAFRIDQPALQHSAALIEKRNPGTGPPVEDCIPRWRQYRRSSFASATGLVSLHYPVETMPSCRAAYTRYSCPITNRYPHIPSSLAVEISTRPGPTLRNGSETSNVYTDRNWPG